MPDYQNGKIYKIVNDINDEIYIGSTCQHLSSRMACHRKDAMRRETCKLYQAMKTIGIEKFRIILIQNYPCNSKEELCSKEDKYIRELKPTLNTKFAVKDVEQERTNNIANHKRWAERNGERLKEYKKDYYKENQEQVALKNKEWREKNAERKKKIDREYALKNAERLKTYKANWYQNNKKKL